MHGTKASNFGVSQCDLLVVVGARFSDRVTGNAKKFAHHAKILQIDIDPAEIDKNILTDASVTGDIKEVLIILNEKVEQQSHEEWKQQIEEYKEKHGPQRVMWDGTAQTAKNELPSRSFTG